LSISSITNEDIETIFTFTPLFNRDASLTSTDPINQDAFFIEMKTNKNQQIVLSNVFNDVINMLTQINKDINIQTNIFNKIKTISLSEIKDAHNLLKQPKILNKYVTKYGPTIFATDLNNIIHNQFYPICDDINNTAILYMPLVDKETVLPILKLTIRPTAEQITNQLNKMDVNLLNEKIYDESIFKKDNSLCNSVGIQIYFSNLMMVLLKKYHLSEVIHSI
jgi:asparagine synthetase A